MFETVLEAARMRAGAQVSDFADQVRNQGQAYFAGRKRLVADQLSNAGDALREAADKLYDTEGGFLAEYVDRAADRFEDAGRYVDAHDLHDVIEDVGSVARRQPLLFASGMFVAGLAAAQLLKAASNRTERNRRERNRTGTTRRRRR